LFSSQPEFELRSLSTNSFLHSLPYRTELTELYYDRRSVGQSVLEQSTHLGLTTRFLLLSDHCGFFIWGALSDERTGLSFTMYNVQYTIYFTVSELRPGPCIYIPQKQGGPVIPPGNGNWSDLTTELTAPPVLVMISRHGPQRKHRSSIVAFLYVAGVTWQWPLFRQLPFSNGSIRHNILEILGVKVKRYLLCRTNWRFCSSSDAVEVRETMKKKDICCPCRDRERAPPDR
jgi:hypothetical protein